MIADCRVEVHLMLPAQFRLSSDNSWNEVGISPAVLTVIADMIKSYFAHTLSSLLAQTNICSSTSLEYS